MDNQDDLWTKRWNARLQALEKIFGPSANTVLHGIITFDVGRDLGGSPDFLILPNYVSGKLYVTSELVGGTTQLKNSCGQYELAIAHADDEEWGIYFLSQLAYETLNEIYEDGDIMDISPAVPEGSTISALIFKRIAEFDCLGEGANVLCCIGITHDELEFAFQFGIDELYLRFPPNYLLSEMYRDSFLSK